MLPVLGSLSETIAPSKIYQILKSFSLEALVLGYSDANLSHIQRKNIVDFLLTLRKIHPFTTGDDLIQWGEKPGKSFDTILSHLFAAQLDGKINSKSEAYPHFQLIKEQAAKKILRFE